MLAFALAMALVGPDRVLVSTPVVDGSGSMGPATAHGLIRSLSAAIAADPSNADAHTRLGNAYLQKVREAADTSYYPRIEAAFRRALALEPGDAGALAGLGALALGRHHFEEGLSYGLRARQGRPGCRADLRRDRRREHRARPLRRCGARAPADGRPEAESRLLLTGLLLQGASR